MNLYGSCRSGKTNLSNAEKKKNSTNLYTYTYTCVVDRYDFALCVHIDFDLFFSVFGNVFNTRVLVYGDVHTISVHYFFIISRNKS